MKRKDYKFENRKPLNEILMCMCMGVYIHIHVYNYGA